jgi:dTDP-4-amino-4,6-dideoxygalactose transaminase
MAPREGSTPPAAARRLAVAEKSGLDQLAIFGGAPAFSEPLHVGRPSLGDRRRLLARLRDMLDRRWLTNNGPYVRELEAGLARLLGVQHCVAVCNGTVGLELAIRATGLAGEVVIPSFTFVATAHALTWHGITPVFCDVADGAPTLDPLAVERLITPRTTGIIGVHVWGRPCDVDALASIARARGLVLLFDAAHALGCTYRGRPVGGFGRAEVFSFHATKFFNTFEGGAIATDDGDLAARLRLMRNFGFAGQDNVIALGINGKMSEASAAMGLTSLESLDRLIAVNRRNDGLYREGLRDCPGIRLLPYDPTERHNYQYVVVEIDKAVAGIGRDAVRDVLWAENVLARRYFYPGCHEMEYYRAQARGAGSDLANTERLAARVLCLPTGTALGRREIATTCRILRLALAEGREVSARLARQGGARAASPGDVRA